MRSLTYCYARRAALKRAEARCRRTLAKGNIAVPSLTQIGREAAKVRRRIRILLTGFGRLVPKNREELMPGKRSDPGKLQRERDAIANSKARVERKDSPSIGQRISTAAKGAARLLSERVEARKARRDAQPSIRGATVIGTAPHTGVVRGAAVVGQRKPRNDA